jgi:hypothetical protein
MEPGPEEIQGNDAEHRPPLKAWPLAASGFLRLVRPPFSKLLGISALLALVTTTLGSDLDDLDLLFTILLLLVSFYLQIATILAAADKDPAPSADHWLKAAWQRRCFWRFALTNLFLVLVLLAALLAFVLPVFLAGAIVALATTAAVLERLEPSEAMRRSAQLTKPARWPVGRLFGFLVLLPPVVIQGAFTLEVDDALGPGFIVIELVAVVIGMVATISLTHAYLALGGTRTTLPRGKGEMFRDH